MSIVSLALLMVINPILSGALSMEYVPIETRQRLEKQFARAKTLTQQDLNSSWSCDMFGMQSHLQVRRNLSLYEFYPSERSVENRGAQVVRSYSHSPQELVGQNVQVIDRVRRIKDGILISELALLGSRKVIAYAKCKAI